MRVVHFCLQSAWTVHQAHDLELIQADLEAGHEVHVVRPSSGLRFSDTRPFDASRRGLRRELRRFWTGIALLEGSVRVHGVDALLRGDPRLAELEALGRLRFETREALDAFRVRDHDAGNAVLSSLIWQMRDTGVEPAAHQDYVERALDTSVRVYLAARAFIERFRPDRVVLFNGRMATFRGILRASQETGTPCLVHERGATLNRVCLARDTLPHDTGWIAREIVETWQSGPESEEEKRAIGRAFYERKRRRDGFSWLAHAASQEPGRLPFEAESRRPLYTVFTSSESERFALARHYRYRFHESQLEGILDLARILERAGFPGLLCIRIHPNSAGERPDLRAGLERRLRQGFVRLVPADSPVDSYALLDASDKVFSFGSTVAMEAAYWGVPSVSFATSPYDQLDSVHQPATREEAVRLVTGPVAPVRSEDALRYGYYYSRFGRPLRWAEPESLYRSRFKGRTLEPRRSTGWRRRRARLRQALLS